MARKSGKAYVTISIPFKGGIYGESRKGRKLIEVFGSPDDHGVGFDYEDFSYVVDAR